MRRLPNAITLGRMILLPVYLYALAQALLWTTPNSLTAATWWFVIMAGSDKLDGFLAKKFDWQSAWGKKWDPLADKAMFASSIPIILLWSLTAVSAGVLTTEQVVIRLALVLTLVLVFARHVALDVQSTRLRSVDGQGAKRHGQIKFALDLLAIALALLGARAVEQEPQRIILVLALICMALGLATLLADQGLRIRRGELSPLS